MFQVVNGSQSNVHEKFLALELSFVTLWAELEDTSGAHGRNASFFNGCLSVNEPNIAVNTQTNINERFLVAKLHFVIWTVL